MVCATRIPKSLARIPLVRTTTAAGANFKFHILNFKFLPAAVVLLTSGIRSGGLGTLVARTIAMTVRKMPVDDQGRTQFKM